MSIENLNECSLSEALRLLKESIVANDGQSTSVIENYILKNFSPNTPFEEERKTANARTWSSIMNAVEAGA